MEALWRDLRLSLRSLSRSPTFVVGTSLVLALGIAMSTVMFTVYKTVYVDRLPITAQEQVVVIHPLDRRGTHLDVPYPYLAVMLRDSALFRAVGAVQHMGAQILPFLEDRTSIELGAVRVSPNLFDMLGTRPFLGRLFRSEDGQVGAPLVIVVSYAAWHRKFAGDPSIIGRTLVVPYTTERAKIVGVAPPGFGYPPGCDVWLPLTSDTKTQVDIVARLAPHVSIDAARSGFYALAQRVNPFELVGARADQGFVVAGVDIHPFAETVLGDTRPAVIVLTLAVALLLLIACVNVGNLVLVRLMSRTREIAVRRAIGAGTSDIVRIFIVETGVIALVGGALGLLVSLLALHVIAVVAPAQLPRVDQLSVGGAPYYIALLVTLGTLLVFGVIPSLVASREGSYAILRADSRTGAESRKRQRARQWLVATQIALALVMLTGAALLVRTLARLQSMQLGYQANHLSIISFTGPQSVFPTATQVFAVAKQLVARIEAIPGIVSATPVESRPFKGKSFFIMQVAPAEQSAAERAHNPFTGWEFVGPDYFRTFEIPIRQGRGFTAADTKGAERVVIVSETLAKQLWPNENALGKRVKTLDDSIWTVIGVVADTHYRDLRSGGPLVYFDWEQQEPFWNGSLAIRTSNTLAATLPSLRAATREVNPNLVVWDARTMDELLATPLAEPRLSASLLTGFSLVALLLSSLGLFGVISTTVRQRTRDIGVRIALGATPGDVRRLVLGDAMRVAGAGAAIGALAALFVGRVLTSQLFGVSPIDPVSVGVSAFVLLGISISAAYIPARHATRIDPVHALRSE
jgi:predicted permease